MSDELKAFLAEQLATQIPFPLGTQVPGNGVIFAMGCKDGERMYYLRRGPNSTSRIDHFTLAQLMERA